MKKSILFLMMFLISACSPSADEHNYRANQAFSNQNYSQALRGYQQAQVQSPDSMIYYFNGALAYAEMSQFNQALSALAIARLKIDFNNENANLYYNSGNIYAQMGHYNDAIGSFRNGLIIDPNHEDMRHNLEVVLLLSQDAPTTPSNPPQPPSSGNGNGDQPATGQLTLERALTILEQVENSQQTWRYFEDGTSESSEGDMW